MGNQYFIFQSQCQISHQLQICHLLVSFIKSGFVFLLGFTTSQSHSSLGISLIKGDFFFLLGFTTSLSVWLSSEDSLIKGAFLFFLACITTSLSLWLSSDDSLMSRCILLDLLRIIGEIQINLSRFLRNRISLFTIGKWGKGIIKRATLACYYGHLQRTGRWHSKRALL